MATKQATKHDIIQIAVVFFSTAMRALQDSILITVERIIELIQRSNYQPNVLFHINKGKSNGIILVRSEYFMKKQSKTPF